jgi:hypothetical protein
MTTRLRILPHKYRGVDGFLVTGRVDGHVFPQRVFSTARPYAEKIRDAMRAGDHAEVDRLLIEEGDGTS